jgi:hypothetical protein
MKNEKSFPYANSKEGKNHIYKYLYFIFFPIHWGVYNNKKKIFWYIFNFTAPTTTTSSSVTEK